MPIYEYQCRACGAKFDKLVFLSAQQKPVHCPECSSQEVEKLVSLIASSSGTSGETSQSSAACTTST